MAYKTTLAFLKKKLADPKLFIFLDQAFYALFNFGSIFLLSKLAAVEVFGSYVIFLTYINFVFIFSTFLLSAPILVLLSKKSKAEHGFYLSSLLGTNVLANLFLSSICFYLMRLQGIEIDYLYIFATPFLMSLFDIFKKFLFSSFQVALKHAAISTILLNLVFFSGIFLIMEKLTLTNILIVYAIAFLIGNSYLLVILLVKKIFGENPLKNKSIAKTEYFNILKQHYHYSKWIILGGVAFWGYSQGLFIFSKSLEVSDFGISKVRTTQNILGVINIFIISVDNYYIPYFSKYIKENPDLGLNKLVQKIYTKNYKKVLLLIFGAFVFALVAYQFLYEEKYGAGLSFIIVFTLIQLLLFFIRPLIISLKAREVTYPFFLAHMGAVIAMLIFGYFAIGAYGYNAMPLTFLISYITFSLILVYFYYRKVYKN